MGVEDVILFTDRLFLNQLNCLTLDRLVGGVGGGGVCDDLCFGTCLLCCISMVTVGRTLIAGPTCPRRQCHPTIMAPLVWAAKTRLHCKIFVCVSKPGPISLQPLGT